MQTARVSRKHQIVIPKRIREALDIRPGDQLLIRVEGDRMVLRLRPRSYARHLRGLHKEIWRGVEATEYVRQERESWGPRSCG